MPQKRCSGKLAAPRAALDAFDQAEKALVLKEDGQKGEPDKGAQKDDGKAVATGDDFSAVPAAVMMFLSAAAAGVLTIKKKRQSHTVKELDYEELLQRQDLPERQLLFVCFGNRENGFYGWICY